MLVLMHCTNCSYETPLFSQFCSRCGNSITVKCKVCYENNLTEARYCRSCGVELAKAPVGLSLERAWSWRDQFNNMGWWSKLKGVALNQLTYLIQQGSFPDEDTPYEPWVFCTPIISQNWKLSSVTLSKDKRIIKSLTPPGMFNVNAASYLLATRCRFALVSGGKEPFAQVFWYKEIASWQYKGGKVAIQLQDGIVMDWSITVAGTNILDLAGTLTSDTVTRYSSVQNIQAKAAAQRDFMSIISQFLKEIGELAGIEVEVAN